MTKYALFMRNNKTKMVRAHLEGYLSHAKNMGLLEGRTFIGNFSDEKTLSEIIEHRISDKPINEENDNHEEEYLTLEKEILKETIPEEVCGWLVQVEITDMEKFKEFSEPFCREYGFTYVIYKA